jgi:mono/diheme cytochrome c family protein
MKILKWIGIVLGSLLLILVIAVAVMSFLFDQRNNKVYALDVPEVAIPTSAEAIAEGERLAAINCAGCHGEQLQGTPFFSAGPIGVVNAPNLTKGANGVGATYGAQDWVHAIRYGVKQDGTSAFIMPSWHLWYMNDTDLGNLLAYVTQVPAVDAPPRVREFYPLGKVLYTLGAFGDQLQAEIIDPATPRPADVPVGETAAYGEYVVNVSGCRSCHGMNLAGGKSGDPAAIQAPNLTPGGELMGWTVANFDTALRTGQTPTGRELDRTQMPWEDFQHLNDLEVNAIWLYLQSLEALPTNPAS